MTSRWARWLALATAVASVCAVAPTIAVAARADSEISGKGSAVAETALGDVAADAMRAATKADVALLPALWLRDVSLVISSSPAGPLAAEAARSALAFPDDEIAVVALKGDQLADMLARGLALVPRVNKGFLQVSGLSVKFDRREPPESRVQEIMVGAQRLDPAKTYKVAMPRALARGALGYFRIFSGVQLTATGVTLADALGRLFAAPGTLSVKVGDRLRDVAPPPAKP
jgi:2',3'-cyclic-nucleotide 2'-phosphodiesterase (5'-nucleotidase family)